MSPMLATAPAEATATTARTDEVLTLAEAAALLKVPADGLFRDVVAGRIPGRSVAGEWRFSRRKLFRWLRSDAPPPAPAVPTFEETPEEQEAFLAHLRSIRKSWGTVGNPGGGP
ncbi:MAG: helix-turn-helix domain-containing protein [Fimbriiglobus sp.]